MTLPVSTRTCLLVGAALLVAGCRGGEPPLSDELESYTDKGDACQQVVAAVTYADSGLRSAGQEQHQEFDAAVRTKIAAVAGTVSLEERDFPSEETLEQARKVADLARETAAAQTRGQHRVRLLREYRREAMQLVLDCGDAVKGL